MRRHKVPELEVEFVNREIEFKNILELPNGRISIIVGPKGCGKTELAKEIVYTFSEDKSKIITLLQYRQNQTYILSNSIREIRQILQELYQIIKDFSGIIGIIVNLLIDFAKILYRLVENKKILKKDLIIIIDEFREIYGEDVRQVLEVESNIVRDLAMMFREYGGRLRIIFMTSDATAIDLLNIVGSKVDWYLMWNLDKESTFKLLDLVNCCENFDIIWLLTSGNPREISILKLFRWDVRRWLADKIGLVVKSILDYSRTCNKDVSDIIREISRFLDDVDSILLSRVYDFFTKYNIVMPFDSRLRFLGKFEHSCDRCVGDFLVFQEGVYYYVLRSIVEYCSVKIDPDSVLRLVS